MRRLSMLSLIFFFLRGRVERDFLLFSLVSKVFPNLFLKMFSIALEFYLIWFAQSSTLMYIN